MTRHVLHKKNVTCLYETFFSTLKVAFIVPKKIWISQNSKLTLKTIVDWAMNYALNAIVEKESTYTDVVVVFFWRN